jgi:ComF family protein
VLLQLLLPARCVACGAPGGVLCGRCRALLGRLDGTLCARCGAPTAWPVARCRECAGRRLAFAQARAAVAYDRAVRRLVHGWKERGLRRVSTLAAELVVEVVPPPRADVVAWVPPDRDRGLERGHSTARGLARELARAWELEAAPLLERTRRVAPQRGLSLPERRRNVRGAFSARAAPSRVCLVDDVYTTGSTASAAASALRAAGAREVSVVAFARTLRSVDSE